MIHGQLTGAYRTFLERDTDAIAAGTSLDRAPITRFGTWIEARTGTFIFAPAFGMFVLGTLLGLVALLVW